MERDPVVHILEQWAEVRPDLDVRPMAVLGRLARIERIVTRRIAATLASHGLHTSEFDVLATLRRHGGALRPVELRAGMMVGSGTLTDRIDRLEAAGLVVRSSDPSDRRGRIIALTDAGRALVDEAVEDHLATEDALLAGLSARTRQRLAGDLSAWLEALVATDDDGPDAPR